MTDIKINKDNYRGFSQDIAEKAGKLFQCGHKGTGWQSHASRIGWSEETNSVCTLEANEEFKDYATTAALVSGKSVLETHTMLYIVLCGECERVRPGRVRQQQEAKKKLEKAREEERKHLLEDLKEMREAVDGGDESHFFCTGCDGIKEEDDLIQVRHCPRDDCDTVFSGEDYGRNCENCNRPFTRKVCDKGCADCMEEESEDLEPLTLEKIDEMIKELS